MDAGESIKKFEVFFKEYYHSALMEASGKGYKSIAFDFLELAQFSPDLAEFMLEKPDDAIKAAEIAVTNIDLPNEVKINVRVSNLPDSQRVMIRDIRAEHIGRFLTIEGTVRQKSDVRPQVVTAKFECPSCGNTMNVLQLDQKFKEPSRCGCGRKGKFRLLSKNLIDAQGIVLEEATKDLEGGEQPKRMKVLLKGDLVSPLSERKTNPGSNVRIIGVVKEVPIILRTGGQSTKYDLMIEANNTEALEEDYSNIAISEEDEQLILDLAKDKKILSTLAQSMAPGIYGHDVIKEAMVLQFCGGTRKMSPDGVPTRGDIHILLIGDPGAGKCLHKGTQIMIDTGEIMTIEEFASRQPGSWDTDNMKIDSVSLPVLSEAGILKKGHAVRVWRRKPEKHLLEIRTRTGRILKVTENHPLFYSANGHIVAKETKDFTIGERIATPRKISVDADTQFIEDFQARRYSNNSKKYTYPKVVSRDVARMLGYLCGDGYLGYSKTSGWISLTNNSDTVLRDFSQLLNQQFAAISTLRNSHKGKSAKEAYLTSKSILDYIFTYFPELKNGSKEKHLPVLISKSPDNVLAEFIKGLFECDSHANVKKKQLEFSTISKRLAHEIQLSLLRFGIVAYLKNKFKRATNSPGHEGTQAYELVIAGEFVEAFNEKIGYVSEEKRSSLQAIISDKRKRNTNVDLVPNVNHILYNVRKSAALLQKDMGIPRGTFNHFELDDRLPSRSTLQKIVSNLDMVGIDTPEVGLLRQFAYSDIFWDEIISVEKVENETDYVYDLEVEHVHNYIAQGIIVHNSQLLKRASIVAPKSRYVSGKGASGAGLTAAVVKDEFLQGWSLEAGALVLANRGIVMIDELDKMTKEDRSAMHEGLEQQSYHHDFELLFADGSTERIGDFVDDMFAKHPDKAINGKDCEILDLKTRDIITTDFQKIFKTTPARISRHLAPPYCHKVTFSNGRTITVTPEHPLFVFRNNRFEEISAGLVKAGMIVPAPRHLPTKGKTQKLLMPKKRAHNKEISLPAQLSPEFASLLGYHLSEGHSFESEKNRYAEIGISNTDPEIVKECQKLFKDLFKTTINTNIVKADQKKKAKLDQFTVRCSSRVLFDYFNLNFPEAMQKAHDKRIPQSLKRSSARHKLCFLQSFFKGDGFVDSERTGYCTSSRMLAEDLQDMLLGCRIYSYIAVERRKDIKYYKVVITGTDSLGLFREICDEKRRKRLEMFIDRSKNRLNSRDCIPYELLIPFNDFLKKAHCNDGYFTALIKRKQNSHRLVLQKYLDKAKKILPKEAKYFEKILGNDIRFLKINKVEKTACNHKWVYDVTVEPTRTFISQGVVLHNTISISKANIQATLRCETTVLAAANPKLGRFDPYETIAKQIDLPPPLINRFDLIFTIKDLPDEDKDKKLANFLLNKHRNTMLGEKEEKKKDGLIDTSLIRKYFVYCRQRIKPILTKDAIHELQGYYVKMRTPVDDSGSQSIPITPRQLEALVRVAEASAKVRLSEQVEKEDAKKAIALLTYCLEQVGMDPETGKIDIDRISGIPSSERNKIVAVRELITKLEETEGKLIDISILIRAAEEKGLKEDDVDDAIEKLTRSGDVFSPKRGFISKL